MLIEDRHGTFRRMRRSSLLVWREIKESGSMKGLNLDFYNIVLASTSPVTVDEVLKSYNDRRGLNFPRNEAAKRIYDLMKRGLISEWGEGVCSVKGSVRIQYAPSGACALKPKFHRSKKKIIEELNEKVFVLEALNKTLEDENERLKIVCKKLADER